MNHALAEPTIRRRHLPMLIAASLAAGGFTAIALTGGFTLSLFFAGILAITLVVPICVSSASSLRDKALLAVLAVGSVGFIWLTAVVHGPVTFGQWICCTAILCAIGACTVGITAGLTNLWFTDSTASAITIALMLAWLSWPIWLSPALDGHQALVNWLVPAHPLLAINGQLLQLGIWTERPMMYRWTALNQDVSYSMPTNPAWCIVLHLVVAAACLQASTPLRSKVTRR